MNKGWRLSGAKTKPKVASYTLIVACVAVGCVLIAFWWQFTTRGFPERFGIDAYAYGGLLLLAVLTRCTVLVVGSSSALSFLLHQAQIRGWRSKVAIALIAGVSHGFVMYHWFELLHQSDYSGGLLPSVLEFTLGLVVGVTIGTAVWSLGIVLSKLPVEK